MCIPVKYSAIDEWNECFLVTSFAFPGLIFFKICSDFAVQIVFQHWNLRSSCFKLKFIIIAIALWNSKFVLSLFLDSVRSGPLSVCVGSSHFSWFRVSMERSYGEKSDKKWREAREDEVRERIPHTWASSNHSFLESNLSYASIFREVADWPVVMTQWSFKYAWHLERELKIALRN